MSVRWTGAARRDLSAVARYLQERSPQGARRMIRRIHEAAQLLDERPQAGKPGREDGTREFVVGRTPYLLVYELERERPLILPVLHGSQAWPPLEQ